MPDRKTMALVSAIHSLACATSLAAGAISSPQGKADYHKHMTDLQRHLQDAMAPDTIAEDDRS